jgi:hypothetical protein
MQQKIKQPHLNTTLTKKHKKNSKFEKSSTNLLNSSPLYVLGLSITYIDVFFFTLSLGYKGYMSSINVFLLIVWRLYFHHVFLLKSISFYYLLPKVTYD